MTKVSVFWEAPVKVGLKKGIELKLVLSSDGKVATSVCDPIDYDNVQLFRKSEKGYYDIILAWNEDTPDRGVVYLGHWNDGVV